MKNTVRTAAAAVATLAVVGFGSTALAKDVRCPQIPAQQWMAIDKAIQKAESFGYSVREAKRSKGCWKVEGYDRNGAEIEIRLDPASGEVVKPFGWRPPSGM
jgi:hypothetical protein